MTDDPGRTHYFGDGCDDPHGWAVTPDVIAAARAELARRIVAFTADLEANGMVVTVEQWQPHGHGWDVRLSIAVRPDA